MFRRPWTLFGVHGRFFLNIGFLRKFVITYSGCQKNVTVSKRFFLQPLMPQFRNSEHFNGKRYKSYAFNGSILEILILGTTLIALGLIVVVKKTFRYSNVFFYNHLCRNSLIRNIIMESGIIRYYEIISIQLPIGRIEYALCQNY